MSAATTIGELRLRATIEAPVDTPDGAGGLTRAYAPLASVWMQLTPKSGEDGFVAGRQEQTITHVARIRWRADVTGQMHFIIDARRLLIHAVHDADERRRFLMCYCEEIKA